MNNRQLIINGVYRHYKGGEYRAIAEATHTETGEAVVVYRRIASGKWFVRPKEMFLDNINRHTPRFELISD